MHVLQLSLGSGVNSPHAPVMGLEVSGLGLRNGSLGLGVWLPGLGVRLLGFGVMVLWLRNDSLLTVWGLGSGSGVWK